MDENVVGMQMNLFSWAAQKDEAAKKTSADVIDAVDVFEYRKGMAIGQRFLREEAGIIAHDPKEPIPLSAWREKA